MEKNKKTPKKASTAVKPAPPAQSAKAAYTDNLKLFLLSPQFGRIFAGLSVITLSLTTLFWTILSARLHAANADQLIDAYLFEDGRTFHGASFPATHSFLIKWPIFALMHLFGNTLEVFTMVTILMVLATVGALVYILHKIEKRPVAFGLLCLALSSVLLLVPAMPYAGALLPVNMAMTTTRNLEYVLFMGAVYYALRYGRINPKSPRFWTAATLAGLLVASDRLFAVMAIGGALLAAAWYYLILKRRSEARLVLRWLLCAAAGVVLSYVLIRIIGGLGITHFTNEQTGSPFPVVHTAKQVGTGLIYLVMAFFTNFGANPIYATIVAPDLPGALLASLQSASIVAYLVNLVLVGVGLYAACKVLLSGASDIWTRLSVILLASTVAIAVVFVLTDHYYPVDARYMTIGLFALFITAATFFRSKQFRVVYLATAAALMIAVIPIGLITATQEFHDSELALAGRNRVTARVSEELSRHKINHLLGDYWDVTPVKAATTHPVTILPVNNCTQPRQVLSSTAWFKRPASAPTAFLAVKDPHKAGTPSTYGGCSLAHVVGFYGVPSGRVVISQTNGTVESPDVLLLLYSGGIHPQPKVTGDSDGTTSALSSHVEKPPVPVMKSLVPLSDNDACSVGTTLQVVAHQDDDLLFMNPDVSRDINDGRCMRTVFVTAGDAGEGINYWGNREKGAQAAYAQMYGVPDTWHEESQTVAGHRVTVAYLDGAPRLALVFMRLPDGNIRGNGFPGHSNESLRKLAGSELQRVESVDDGVSYTRQEIVDALHEIIIKDAPDQIRTQGSTDVDDGDHSDHHTVGLLTTEAAATYELPHAITYYLGYPDKALPPNLSDDDVTRKQVTFLAYAKFDGAVCQSAFECQNAYTYGSYLTRQYQPIATASP